MKPNYFIILEKKLMIHFLVANVGDENNGKNNFVAMKSNTVNLTSLRFRIMFD